MRFFGFVGSEPAFEVAADDAEDESLVVLLPSNDDKNRRVQAVLVHLSA